MRHFTASVSLIRAGTWGGGVVVVCGGVPKGRVARHSPCTTRKRRFGGRCATKKSVRGGPLRTRR